MLKRITFIVSIIISSSFAFSSDNDTSKIYIKEPEAKALEFGMSGLFEIQEGLGGNFSYKSFQTSNSAKRLGVTFRGNVSLDFNNWENSNNTDSSSTENEDTSTDYYLSNSIELVYQKIKYLQPNEDIALYYGYGPKVGYSLYIVSDERGSYYGDVTTKQENKRNRLYAGLSTVVGVEWFYRSNISLYAEYQNDIVLGVDQDKDELIRSSLDKFTSKDESIGPYLSLSNKVNLGVSFYFK